MPYDPYSQESSEIDQRRKYAEMLRQQAGEVPQTQMVGNRAIPISWTQGLAQGLKGYMGGQGVRQADEQQKQLASRLRGDTADWSARMPQGTPAQTIQPDEQGMGMTPMQQPAQQPSMQQYAGWLGQAPNQQAAAMGSGMIGMQQRQQEGDEQRQFRAQEAAAARQASIQQLQARIEAEERAGRRADDLKRELAGQQEALRRELQTGQQSFQRQMAADARANRPAPAPAPVIETAEGIFERTPQGLRQLNAPGTNTPLTPKGKAGVAAKGGDVEKTLNTYVAARNGLLTGLGGSVTGPYAGRFPAVSSAQQTAEGGVSAMAPVLKQIFRVAGEGTFTDKDQEQLMNMLPTRADRPDARAAKIKNIDAIIAAKLGVQVPEYVPPTPPTDTPQAGADVMRKADEIIRGSQP